MLNSIHSKLIVLVGLPLLAIVFILVTLIFNKYNTVREMEELEPLSQLSAHIGELIHEIQMERGMSSRYLVYKHGRDRKEKTLSSLLEQRKKRNVQVQNITRYLETFNSAPYGVKFQEALSLARKSLADIDAYSAKIDDFEVTANEAIAFYSNNNSLWLRVIHLSSELTENAEISLLRSSYGNFLRGKEYAGIERALLWHVFSVDQFEANDYSYFQNILIKQEFHFEQFEELASEEEIAFFDKVLESPSAQEVQRMRDVALSSVSGGFGVSPEYWFDTATKKINLLHAVENKIAEDLRQRGMMLKLDAQKALGWLVLFMVAIIFLVLVTAKFMVDAIHLAFIELEKSKEVIENLVDGIITINETGIVTGFTHVAAEIFGYLEDEVIGQNISMLMPQPYSSEHDGYIQKYIQTGEEKVIGKVREVTGLRKDGSEFPVELSVGRAIIDGTTFFIGSVRDVTKKKKVEAELTLAKEAAEQAARTKSAFLARMSHEIRTPMNGIIGTASLIEGTDLNEKQKQYVHTIKSSGNSLLTILNEILDFSALEAGKIKIKVEPFDLYRCADEVYHLFQAPIQEKGLEFHLEYGALPEYVVGDQGRIRQVIVNLLNNAMKFTDSGLVGLNVSVFEQKNGNQYIKFLIRDTGTGIPKDKLHDLFKTFSQVDESSVRKTGGTGLGLSICNALIGMMGGEIGVDSIEGEGSEFWFTIPLVIPSEKELTEYSAKNIQKEVLIEYTAYDASILLVEDVEVNVFVITEILEGYGCSVDHAENGEIAIKMAADKNYDIIFMDCQMPIMNGFQATTEIRRTNKDVPIIALTANVLTEEREKCFEVGMNAFIPKPVTKEDFASVLNAWIPELIADYDETGGGQNSDERIEASIDFQALEQFGDNANKIVELTFKDVDIFIKEIERAIKDGGTEDLGLAAHSLKSVVAQIGAVRLFEMARELELRGKNSNLNEADCVFAALKLEYDAVKQFLKKHIDGEA